MSLSGDERRAVTEAFIKAAAGRVPVIIQVGHNSIAEACQLAAHAQQAGADVISATAPSYFKVASVEGLVDCVEAIAGAAPDLPFYYYHIPALTGAAIEMGEFLQRAADRVPTLRGLKYTTPQVHEYQYCLELDGGRFDVLWGCDEMLLSALVVGARGGVGSTYNIAAPLYQRIIAAFEAGDLDQARQLQLLSVKMIRVTNLAPFHPMMKQLLRILGMECGECRSPHPKVTEQQVATVRAELEAIGFFDWARSASATITTS